MVGADHGRAIALAGHHLGTAMSAAVGKGTDFAVLATHHRHRHADELHREVVARIRDPVGPADEVPDLHEDLAHLLPIEGLRSVALGRKRFGFEQGPARFPVGRRIQDLPFQHHAAWASSFLRRAMKAFNSSSTAGSISGDS